MNSIDLYNNTTAMANETIFKYSAFHLARMYSETIFKSSEDCKSLI